MTVSFVSHYNRPDWKFKVWNRKYLILPYNYSCWYSILMSQTLIWILWILLMIVCFLAEQEKERLKQIGFEEHDEDHVKSHIQSHRKTHNKGSKNNLRSLGDCSLGIFLQITNTAFNSLIFIVYILKLRQELCSFERWAIRIVFLFCFISFFCRFSFYMLVLYVDVSNQENMNPFTELKIILWSLVICTHSSPFNSIFSCEWHPLL